MGMINLCLRLKPLQDNWKPATRDRIFAVESKSYGYVMDPEMAERNKDIVFYCPNAEQIIRLMRAENMKRAWKLARKQISLLKDPDPDTVESILLRAYVLFKYAMAWDVTEWVELSIFQVFQIYYGGLLWTCLL